MWNFAGERYEEKGNKKVQNRFGLIQSINRFSQGAEPHIWL